MEFLRPEVKEGIWRWREALVGFSVSMLGLFWAINSIGFMSIVGTSLAIAGALLVFAGIQRARFRVGSGGTGVVYVDEGQVTYYGPIDGGTVSVADLTLVELDPNSKPFSEWILHDPGSAPLRIPTNAEGAEALFDVFSGLDGLHTEKMLTELNNAPESQVIIWQSKIVALH